MIDIMTTIMKFGIQFNYLYYLLFVMMIIQCMFYVYLNLQNLRQAHWYIVYRERYQLLYLIEIDTDML